MVGAGAAASIIQARAAGSLITWLATAFPLTYFGGFRDLTLDGNATGTTGLDITGATTFKWSNLVIENFTGIGAKLRAVLMAELSDCYFVSNATGVDIDQYAFGGLMGTIRSNLLKLDNCRFDSNASWALHSDNSSVIVLDKCDLEVNGTAGNATTGTVYYKSAIDNMLGLVVKGCWFESIEGKAGIVFDIPRTSDVQNWVQDTQFSAAINSTYGIYVNGTSTAQKVICQNVEFYADAGSGDFYADGANATLDLHYGLGTTGGAGTINSYPPYGGAVPTGANPTAEVGPSAINGAAATFMRSDAAPKLADTAVTPGTYGDATNVAQFTVDQQGRITAASQIALSAIPTVIYSPLTNGDPVSPALVFDPANGDVIMIAT